MLIGPIIPDIDLLLADIADALSPIEDINDLTGCQWLAPTSQFNWFMIRHIFCAGGEALRT